MNTILEGSTLLITGIMAAGKSTIAQQIAERLPRSVHLRGDLFRRMVVNGRVEMTPDPSPQAMRQLRLRYELAALVAQGYCENGFAVTYQDVILGPILHDVVALHRTHPLYLVVLCPSPDVALERDQSRHKQAYHGWTARMLDEALHHDTPHLGLWLDNSLLSVTETVETILARLGEARVEPS